MRRLSLARWGLLIVLLIAAAGGLWYRLGLASRAAAPLIEPLPRLGYVHPTGRPVHQPVELNRAFFEEQTTIDELMHRLERLTPQVESTETLAPKLAVEFERREQGRVAKTPQGILKLDDAEPGDGLAVSASGSVIALAKGEHCLLFDVTRPEDATGSRLQIQPRTEPAKIALTGRVGQQLLLDYEGEHVIYLGAGGVVYAADAATGAAAPIDRERLSKCELLGGGSRGGWMIGGTERGEVILFDLRGTIIKSQEIPRANPDYPPGLKSIACDPDGQIVLAGYDNDELRWFRRQQDQLTVDGGLIEFPGTLQSVAVNQDHFAVAGEHFYMGCLIPEPGEPINTQRSAICTLVHQQTQIALSDRDDSPYFTIWGETPQIRSDRSTAWLYAVDIPTSHTARPFRTNLPATTSLRALSPGGSLVAAVSGDVLVAAQPAGIDTTPPSSFGDLLRKMLDEERYEEIEQCTRYLGQPQGRFPADYQSAWIECLAALLLPEDGDYRVREQRLIAWLDEHPDSLTAWLALADHYFTVAYAARGTGWASDVSEFGWEVVERDTPKADGIMRTLLAASYSDPAVIRKAASLTGLAGWSLREKRQLSERAVELFPGYVGLHHVLAYHRLRRWGGSAAEALGHIEKVAAAADEKQQDAYYAILAAELMLYQYDHPAETGVEPLPVDMERVARGLDLPRPEGYSTPWALLHMARNAAGERRVDMAGFCLDQFIREDPVLPKKMPIATYRHLCEWARTGQALLRDHRKKIEQANVAAELEMTADAATAAEEPAEQASAEPSPIAVPPDAGLSE